MDTPIINGKWTIIGVSKFLKKYFIFFKKSVDKTIVVV